jgi:integrase/recombinase XerD
MKKASAQERFACLVQQFFLERLERQRNASPQTVAAYRDAFRLLLTFGDTHRGKPAESFTLADLDSAFVLAFLDYLETQRHNTIRSRNARLAAIRSFLRFASLQEPAALPAIQRVLAIPLKRCDKPLLGYLTREEMQAILNAPDAATWPGRRDRVLLATLYNTGARVSEAARFTVADVAVEGSASIRIHGKGRKERLVPLWRTTAQQIRRWLPEVNAAPEGPLFPSRFGTPLTRSAITERLQRAVRAAIVMRPQLAGRRISPHTLRHYAGFRTIPGGASSDRRCAHRCWTWRISLASTPGIVLVTDC